jgi:hypothetical protein
MVAEALSQKDIKDGEKICILFSNLSEENKTMAMVYLSALRDKEMAEQVNKQKKE